MNASMQAECTSGRGTYVKGKYIYASAAGIPQSFAPQAASGAKVDCLHCSRHLKSRHCCNRCKLPLCRGVVMR